MLGAAGFAAGAPLWVSARGELLDVADRPSGGRAARCDAAKAGVVTLPVWWRRLHLGPPPTSMLAVADPARRQVVLAAVGVIEETLLGLFSPPVPEEARLSTAPPGSHPDRSIPSSNDGHETSEQP